MLLIYDYWILRYAILIVVLAVSFINRRKIAEKLSVLEVKKV